MADVKGGLPTKRNTTMMDHEVYMAKIRLGASEKMSSDAILGGGGDSNNPVECATVANQTFLDFHFKSAVTGKSITGIKVTLNCATNLSMFDTALYGIIAIPAGKTPRNPTAIQGEMTITATGKCQGTAAIIGAYGSLPGETMNGMGSMYGVSAQIDCAASFSFPDKENHNHALFMGAMGGDGTAKANFLNAFLFADLPSGNKAAKKMHCNADCTAGGSCTGGLRVKVNGTNYWIPLYSI